MSRRPIRRTGGGVSSTGPVPGDDGPSPQADGVLLESAPVPVLIEVDPRVVTGFTGDRYDLTIRGRVVSASPAQEIALRSEGQVISVVRFGAPEHAAWMTLPDGGAGFLRPFHFNLFRSRENAAGPCRVSIAALTADGHVREEHFDFQIDLSQAAPVLLVAGPAQPLSGDMGIRPPIVSFTERATLDGDGILLVQGWSVSLTPVVAVQLFLGDSRVAAAMLGGRREDVAFAFPSYPNAATSGFAATTQLNGLDRNAQVIRVRATGQYGYVHEVMVPLERIASAHAMPGGGEAPEPEYDLTQDETPAHDISMYCDIVTLTEDGTLQVSGWAVSASPMVSILIYLNDVLVGEALRGRARPDVGAEYPDIPSASQSGFLFDRRVGDRGEPDATVRVIVRCADGGERSENLPVGALLPARAIQAAPNVEEPIPEEPGPESGRFRFELDSPRIVRGAAPDPITGRLTIEGWVLARSGVARIDIFLNGQKLGAAHHGLARQDVAGAFPEWENALRSGYAFHCPPRSLRDGEHTVQLVVEANDGEQHRESFTITVQKVEGADDGGAIRRRVTRAESELYDALMGDLAAAGAPARPTVQLYIRGGGDWNEGELAETLNTIRLQAYRAWHVTVLAATPAQTDASAAAIAGFGGTLAARVSVIGPSDPAWHAPLSGDLVGFLCPGDALGADALAELALASLMHPAAGMIYGDETRTSPVSQERESFFKPDFSPDLLLATNYIGRPCLVRRDVAAGLGVTPASLARDGEFDFVLRASEQAGLVYHVARLLAQRGGAEPDDAALGAQALERTLTRRGIEGRVLSSPVRGTWRIQRRPRSGAKVSIIIPTCAAHGYIETCLSTLRARTTYPNYEIVVVDNIPSSQMAWKVWLREHADKVVDMPDGFNWSRFNNKAVDVADGEYLLFLNDDIEFFQDDWLDVLMGDAERPEVGIVGARLLYPDRKVQHAGMFLSNNGIGRHAFRFAAEDEPGYFGLALTQRNAIAVTGACMLVRRSVFDSLGRFDELHQIVNNDLDFCLRAHRAGLLTVVTPHATLIHHELASRDRLKDIFDLSHFNANWKTRFGAGDPYFNPNLFRHADDVRPDDEPVEVVHAGYPLFVPEDIERILVLKLDHIGDFITSLPAIRQLKAVFPHAHLTVLAGPASRAFAAMEPAVDEFIEFAFFHARSQLGERTLTEDDFSQLAALLRPRRFDLAVDLRKHGSTRDVMRHCGARFMAGFDYAGQFPFLDIALEWDGDRALYPKRGHVVDDLLSLVAMIGLAAGRDRRVIVPRPQADRLAAVPEDVRWLFDKPVVAVHAGAGNINKQWPEEHFSTLIDMLTETGAVNVLIVGGSDEQALSDTLAAGVLNTGAVASIAGRTSLGALPGVLQACNLYIGNDSGPKHIAAGLGVPTIGIHSGVVDAKEWGPIGPRAVAIRRAMSCSPCYLAVAADCPRELACLRMLEPVHVYRQALAMLARPDGELRIAKTPAADDGTDAGLTTGPAQIADKRGAAGRSKQRRRAGGR